MKAKYLIMVALILAILTIGAVSASDDSISDDGNITASPEDAMDESSVDDNLIADDDNSGDTDELISDYDYSLEVADSYLVNRNIYVYGMLPNDASGTVNAQVDGINTDEKELDGDYFYLDLGCFNQKDSHDCLITYSGDHKYAGFTYQKTFDIADVEVNFPDEVTRNYGESWIRVDKDATGQLTINFDGIEYKSGAIDELMREYDYGIYYVPVTIDFMSFGPHAYEVSYTDNNGTIRLTGSFNKTYKLEVLEDLYSVPYGKDFNITVDAPDDARSNITVNLNGNSFEYTLNGDETTITLTNLVFGQNTLTLTYSDDKYPLKTVKYLMNVKGVFITPEGTFDYTTDEVISLTLPEGAVGMLQIYKNIEDEDTGETYEKYFDSVFVKNGYAAYPIKRLGLGNHRLVVKYENGTYDVDDEYVYFDIYPVITYDKGATVGQDAKFTVEFPEGANGNLLINTYECDDLGDPIYWEADPIVLYDGQVESREISIDLNTSKKGFFRILFSYEEGDVKLNDKFVFNVYDNDNNWQLDVDFPKVLFQGQEVYIPINYPEGANGDLNFYVDGNRIRTIGGVGREDSNLDFTADFNLGTHTWEIKYSGDTYYTDSSQNGTFEVTWVDVPEVMEIGGNTNIEVNVIGGSGSVKLKIDGNDYDEQALLDNHATFDLSGVSQGTHTYEITYGNLTESGSFEMSYMIDVYVVGSEYDNSLVFLKSYEIAIDIHGAMGSVDIIIDGSTYEGFVESDSPAVVNVPLKWGKNNLTIRFHGDEGKNYSAREIQKTFIVDHGEVIVNSEKGKLTEASLYLPEDAQGNLIIYDYNKDRVLKSVALQNGEASIDAEGLPAGCYYIEIRYGDEDYKVEPKSSYVSIQPEMNITGEINEGDDCIIDIELPGSSGMLYIYVDDEQKTSAEFRDGKLHAVISDLTVGNHTITFQYYDDNYMNLFEDYDEEKGYYQILYPVEVKPSEAIDPDFNIFIDNVEFGDPIIVRVTANEAFEGAVTVKIDENNVLVNVVKGEGSANADFSLPAGNYTATIDFEGNDDFKPGSAQADFEVTAKDDTPQEANMEIIVNNIDLGDNATITVNINNKATGIISVKVTKKPDGFVLNESTYSKTLTENVVKGVATFTFDDLEKTGVYEITATYSGDAYISSESKESSFKVLTDSNIEIIAVDEIEENETLTVTVKRNCADGDHASLLVNVKGSGSAINFQVIIENNATSTVTFDKLAAGDATIEVSLSGSNHFKDTTVYKPIKITPHLLDPNLKIEIPEEINEGDTAIISFTINENASGTVTVNVDGVTRTVTKFKYDSFGSQKYTFEFENLAHGMKNVTVSYSGNYDPNDLSSGNGTQLKYFAKANKTGSFYIKPIPVSPELDASANEIYDGQNATITVTINNNVTGKVTIKVDGEDNVIDIFEGRGTFTTPELTSGEHNFTISFEGDEYFLAENKTVTVNVKENRVVIIPINTEVDYQDGSFTFKLINPDTNEPLANKTVKISGNNSAGTGVFWTFDNGGSISVTSILELTSDENGIVTLDATFYPGIMIGTVFSPADTYNMNITGSGNLKGSNVTILKVNKIDLNITIEEFNEYYGAGKKFTIFVANAKTGKAVQGVSVNFTVTKDGKEINFINQDGENVTSLITDSEGKIELPAGNLLAGEYNISANVVGTSNFNGNSAAGLATINKIPIVINAENKSVDYCGRYAFNITKDGAGLEGVYVLVKLDNGTENADQYLLNSTADGVISLYCNFDVGTYNLVIISADGRYVFDQVNKSITVNPISSSINISDAVFDYAEEHTIPYSLAGASDINVKLNVTGDHVFKDENALKIRNLLPGTYLLSIETIADKNHYAITKNVTVTVNKLNPDLDIEIKSVEESNPVNVIVKTNTMFSGNLSVQIGNANYTVSVQNGYGALNISNWAAGNYSAKVIFNSSDIFNSDEKTTSFSVIAKKVSEPVKKPDKITLTLKKVKVKKSAKKLVLKATLKINGKYAKKGTKVVFKFKGKKYTAKVKAKGVAKVTIKKKVLKKLKVGKKVKYQVSYGKKTVKRTVKVRK